MIDKIPHNLEAEMSLLGCLILDQNSVYSIIEFIEPEDFYNNIHQNIYKAYISLFTSGIKIDVLTLGEKLESQGILEQIGGKSYLVSLANSVPTSSNIQDYAKIIKDKSLRRQILEAQTNNFQEIYNEDKDINSVLASVQNSLYQINPVKTKSDNIKSILGELNKLQDEYSIKYESGKKILGFSSGIDKLDDIIDGLRPGHLWVVGAWHGTGKTSFALNIVHSLLEQNIPVSVVSTEMSQVDLTAKLIGIRHKISAMKVIKGKFDNSQLQRIKEAKQFLEQSNLEIHTEFDYEKIMMQIRKDVYTRGVKVVMIDYIQKLTHSKIYDETPLMAKIAQGLSNLAQELRITIILLSQISNEAQKGSGAGAGYKGSGAIEASADLALLLRRDKDKEMPEAEIVEMDIKITKNKFGLDGIIKTYFHLKSGQVSQSINLEDISEII